MGRSRVEGASPDAKPENSLLRSCDVWTIRYQGETGDYTVKGNKCLQHLAKVLGRPNHLFPISDLVGDPEGKLGAESKFVSEKEVDPAGLRALKRDLDEVEALLELSQTEGLLQRKLDLLEDIKRAEQGRTLREGSPTRKAHHNIASQIRTFIREKLSHEMPQLACHLKATLKLDFPSIGYCPPTGTPAWAV